MTNQGRDRTLVSNQDHELEYIHQQFPKHSHEQVLKAVADAKKALGGSESREKIMEHLRRSLK